MNRTKIEWVKNPDGSQGYTWNPITGCLNGCPYCYARKLANGRLKPLYSGNHNTAPTPPGVEHLPFGTFSSPFYPRFWPERIKDLRTDIGLMVPWTKDRGIFVCDMGELFGDWVPANWQEQVFKSINKYSWHRFYLLTKQPQNLIKWSPFPLNCYVGVSVTDTDMMLNATRYLNEMSAKVKFISFEPLLWWDNRNVKDLTLKALTYGRVNWVIIGACTGTETQLLAMCQRWNIANVNQGLSLMPYGNKWTLQPKLEWVNEIVGAADKVGIPVFLKDNLTPLLDTLDITGTSFGRLTSLDTSINRYGCRKREWYRLRQEMPR